MNEKTFSVQENIGNAKYVVSYHNGTSKHNDGSPFYDVFISKNKKSLNDFIDTLTNEGYVKL